MLSKPVYFKDSSLPQPTDQTTYNSHGKLVAQLIPSVPQREAMAKLSSNTKTRNRINGVQQFVETSFQVVALPVLQHSPADSASLLSGSAGDDYQRCENELQTERPGKRRRTNAQQSHAPLNATNTVMSIVNLEFATSPVKTAGTPAALPFSPPPIMHAQITLMGISAYQDGHRTGLIYVVGTDQFPTEVYIYVDQCYCPLTNRSPSLLEFELPTLASLEVLNSTLSQHLTVNVDVTVYADGTRSIPLIYPLTVTYLRFDANKSHDAINGEEVAAEDNQPRRNAAHHTRIMSSHKQTLVSGSVTIDASYFRRYRLYPPKKQGNTEREICAVQDLCSDAVSGIEEDPRKMMPQGRVAVLPRKKRKK